MNDKLLSIDQVSEFLGVHRDTVYAMIHSGRLPAFQLGGRKASWRISERDLQDFVDARKAASAVRNGHDSDSFDDQQANARAEFVRQQQLAMGDFQREQAGQRATFESEQTRLRQERRGQRSTSQDSGG